MDAGTVMDNTVAIAALGLAGSSVAGIIWLAKYFAKELLKGLKAHTEAAVVQADTNREMLRFMRNLNGKLEGAVVHKGQEVREQHVENQYIKENE